MGVGDHMPSDIGKIIMIIGGLLFTMGALLFFGGRMLGLGRLPGDIIIRRGNFTFYFPIVTSIVLSLLLSIIFKLLRR